MNLRFIISLFIVLALGCSQPQEKASSLLDFIPQNAAIVVKINNLDGFKSDLKNNEFLSKLESFGIYKSVTDEIKNLEHLKAETESILTFSELGADNFEFTFVTHSAAATFVLDSVQNGRKESMLLEDQKIDKYDFEGDILYGISLHGKIVISSSKVIIENLIKYFDQSEASAELEKLYDIASASKNASFFINLEKSEPLSKSLLKEHSTLMVSHFSDWILLDINMTQNRINLNGISTAKDSVTNYLNLFRDTNPLANTTPALAPRSADAILSYTFDDYGIFARNQQRYLQAASLTDSLLSTVEEIGFIYENGSKTIILNTYG
ncbi:MAG: ribonuclease HII, partial [Maribacter sp.]|nr:ribonuclease HII [Maribacter sp.]